MDILIILLLVIFCGGGSVWAVLSLRRNEEVFAYRNALVETVSKQANRDIEARRPWKWRYDALNAVSYQQMVRQLWRPLDSFFADTAFLEKSCDAQADAALQELTGEK